MILFFRFCFMLFWHLKKTSITFAKLGHSVLKKICEIFLPTEITHKKKKFHTHTCKYFFSLRKHIITKTYLYNFDPLKPHFYIVKLGFTGVYIIFLISAQNIDCGYSLELPHRGNSNKYPQSMFWAEIRKIYFFFYQKMSIFLVVKFSVHLNRHVFVMCCGYSLEVPHIFLRINKIKYQYFGWKKKDLIWNYALL